MVDRVRKQAIRRWWVRTALAAGGLGVAIGAICSARQPAASTAQTTRSAPPAASAAPAADSDYTTRPVAFIGHDTVITREELGEFLVLRRGGDKADLLVNRRIIDLACREAGVEVTAGEVEASFAEDLKGFGGISQGDFVKQVLRRYGKNLIEWKEDVIRPKLMLSKLSRTRVHVTEQDIQAYFEAHHGEKVECRIIEWLNRAEAEAAAAKARESEQTFGEMAKNQRESALASTGGKIKPINRHLSIYNAPYKDPKVNDLIENEAFRLQPGEVSGLITIPLGESNGDAKAEKAYIVIKCDRRLPADATVNPAAVRDELIKEITESKTLAEIPKVVQELRTSAGIQQVTEKKTEGPIPPFVAGSSRGRVIAYIHGDVPVSREELGEFLIARYGAETLELLVNKRIIGEACKAKGITVDEREIESALADRVAAAGGSKDDFEKKILNENHTSLRQYREDVLLPQLQLAKLSADRVQVTEEDLKACFEAYYGEKIECRLILWPREERKYAMKEYAELRDSEKAFAEKASKQASHVLAGNNGHLMDGDRVRLIGRHTLGNPDMERELFSLQPGEVSKLVETPEGIVVMKCDRRVPPDGSVALDSIRQRLTKEVRERKIQAQIPVVFADLRKVAEPRLLLRDPSRPIDLKAEVDHDLQGGGVQQPSKRSGRAPAGN
jgi:hypothetical protein